MMEMAEPITHLTLVFTMKTFFALALATLLIAGGIFLWLNPGAISGLWSEPSPEPVATTTQQADTRATYASSTLGVSVRYPTGFTVDERYVYQFSETKAITGGVKFTIPAAFATGTNLSPDTYISLERLPRANNCTGDIYVRDNVRAQDVTEGAVQYSLASTTGAAAGNRYEEWAYAINGSEPCTAVRYYIHYTALENYPEGTVREFDRAALLRQFDEIRRSLTLTQTP